MKKLLPILVVALLLTGCTSVKSPAGWEYKSWGFQKQIAELTVGTNGTIHLRGYTSKDAQFAEGIARGITTGFSPVK